MKSERLTNYPLEIHPRRPYRNFFLWSANLPFQREAIDEIFRLNPWSSVVHIVGLANITNLIQIAEEFSAYGPAEIRIFDAAWETQILLPFYFEEIMKVESDQKNSSLTSWTIPEGTDLPVVNHESCKTNSQMTVVLLNYWYEDSREDFVYDADIIYVDKTLMWASNPNALLNKLAFASESTPERKILLSIYQSQPIMIHALSGGNRIGGIRRGDKVSYPPDTYPGTLITLSDILKDGERPVWQIERPGRLYAYPKRSKNITYWIPDFDPEIVDMTLPIYTRQYGPMSLTKEATDQLSKGQREFWLGGDRLLNNFKTSEQDQKILIGAFDIVDAVITPDQIDLYRIRKALARKFYSGGV